MAKLGFFSLIAAFVATLAVVGVSSQDVSAAKPCARKKFDTKMAKDACAKGGQDEAKKVMKAFLKEAKKTNADLACATCHTKVGGDYPLKPDGLTKFKAAGGK